MAAKGKLASSESANNSKVSISSTVINESDSQSGSKNTSKQKSKWKQKKKINYYLSKEDIQFLIANTRYSEQELREWHQNYREECPEGVLDKDHIIKIYDEISPFGSSKDFVDQIFRIFDKDGDGTIDFKEFMLATDMTSSGTPEEKLRWAFKMYDKDGSGTIELNEMIEVMSALHMGNDGSRTREAAELRGKRIFGELDINGDGEISCEEFVRGCMHDPELVRIISAGGIDPMEADAD